jgi:hypothetical protein
MATRLTGGFLDNRASAYARETISFPKAFVKFGRQSRARLQYPQEHETDQEQRR